MLKRALLAVALVSAFGVAQASNNNGCQGNCPGGDTANNTTNAGGAGGNAHGGTGIGVGIGQGGQGGAGGQGGTAIGNGGHGGSVLGSGNSANTNRNDNRNTNLQGQAQGQQQGQGQAQSSRNDNRSSAKNEGNNSSQSVTVQGDTYEAARIPVATAYAAPLAASNGTCMGSSSAGFQGMSVGISLGSTWNDTSCDMRYDAEALRQAGLPQAAVARLCQKAEIAEAMTAAGTPCPKTKPAQVAVTTAADQRTPTAAEKAVRYTGTDPIVRRRLGLPPL